MEWWVILSVGLMVLLSLFMSGLPIYLCFLVINVVGVLLTFGQAGFGMFKMPNSKYFSVHSLLGSYSSSGTPAEAMPCQ